ncbi:hypothetical protein EV586_101479 [Tumebacillus sp. BK434]|uniref:hypothetical protein n=1 Tax=Tumebacillus sp. BK434 TaxID=2512169 RepID=UPI0010D2238F|nr:hypothetical protein [Tumebacillus sp. BK434]TCP59263.1 hypothetical protein EV586_101479 [Tumebacillus sp. BK434]
MVDQVKAKISMTTFLDFTLLPDGQKVRKVKEIKSKPYSWPGDYWGPLRGRLKKTLREGADLTSLSELLNAVDEKKQANYRHAINGICKFAKKHKLQYFDAHSGVHVQDDFAIRVNPELGLIIDGVPHLIKLYFKEATTSAEIQLNKSRASTIGHLMEKALLPDCSDQFTKMSILNVAKGTLSTPTVRNPLDQDIALEASIAHFMRIWNRLEREEAHS